MKIRITPPDGARWELNLPDAPSTAIIGRGDDCAVTLPERTVSRRHAELFFDEVGTLMVRDGGSRYGTLLNGREVREPVPFYHADVLSVGGFILELRDGSEVDAGALTTPMSGMDTRRLKRKAEEDESREAVTVTMAYPRAQARVQAQRILSWLWVVLLLVGLAILGFLLVDYLGGTAEASERDVMAPTTLSFHILSAPPEDTPWLSFPRNS